MAKKPLLISYIERNDSQRFKRRRGLAYYMIIDRGNVMQPVTLSTKFQVFISRSVRESSHLRPGQKMQIIEYAGRIELIPTRDIASLRGFLKGINTDFDREDDRI
jgi:bifunctional DNA-binding transcriptional regulator/antitoxin component of YhaV-PrlF toxin-antitoxin module